MLEFHLPFIAWREQARKDGRTKADGTPLRSSQSLPSLLGSHESAVATQGTLHDAQVSCVVTGFNTAIWTAWVMSDTYFHDVEDSPNNKDMLEYYDDPDEKGDPLTRGALLVDPPLWDPREYFLKVLQIRLKQVEEEWRYITYVVKTNVKTYVRRELPYLSIPRTHSPPQHDIFSRKLQHTDISPGC